MCARALIIASLIAMITVIALSYRHRTTQHTRNDGVWEMARFFAFAETCYGDRLVPFGELRAIHRNAIKLGYNPANQGMIVEAAYLSKQIKKDEADTICGEYQAHIDKVIYAYGYKAGSEN